MKKGRSIVKEIRTSETFGALTYRQRDLFQGLIEVADDQGRLVGTAAAVRSSVWPYDEVSLEEVQAELNVLASGKDPFIKIYKVDEKTYLQIINWWTYQPMNWAQASSYPAPSGWVDRVRIQSTGGKILTVNWDKKGGFNDEAEVSSGVGSRVDSQVNTPQGTGLINDKDKDNQKKKLNKEKVKLTGPGQQLLSPDPALTPEKAQNAWNRALGDLRAQMGKADFDTWVKPAQFSGISGEVIRIETVNQYGLEFLARRAQTTLEHSLRSILENENVKLEFGLKPLAPPGKQAAAVSG